LRLHSKENNISAKADASQTELPFIKKNLLLKVWHVFVSSHPSTKAVFCHPCKYSVQHNKPRMHQLFSELIRFLISQFCYISDLMLSVVPVAITRNSSWWYCWLTAEVTFVWLSTYEEKNKYLSKV